MHSIYSQLQHQATYQTQTQQILPVVISQQQYMAIPQSPQSQTVLVSPSINFVYPRNLRRIN